MASYKDPNAGISWLDDGPTKDKIAKQAQHALEMADVLKNLPPLDPNQIEAERFQYESNEYAAQNPLYAAARAASNFLVLPLEPNGTKPLVDLKEATRVDRQLYEWWQTWPDANPGVLLGRIGGIFALKVEDLAAYIRLREMATVEQYDKDTDTAYFEHRDLGGYAVRLMAPSRPFSVRMRSGWGKEFTRAVAEKDRELEQRQPQTFWLISSYHHVVSNMDCWDFRSRTVLPGVKLLGEGEVLGWSGSVLQDGITVTAPMSKPPEVPIWLAKTIGKPRSRKAMEAQRQQYEADLKAINAYWMAVAEAQRVLGEQAMRAALADKEKATKALEEAERG